MSCATAHIRYLHSARASSLLCATRPAWGGAPNEGVPSTGVDATEHTSWQHLLAWAEEQPLTPGLAIVTTTRVVESFTRPVLALAADGSEWLLKGPWREDWAADAPKVRRSLVAEQVVARLGRLLDAPVPEAALVVLTEQLRSQQAALAHLELGWLHASRWLRGASPVLRSPSERAVPRDDAAALAVLLGWCEAHDAQFVVTNSPSRLWGIDFGAYLADGFRWSVASLEAHAFDEVRPHATLHTDLRLGDADFAAVRRRLLAIDDVAIARVVAQVPAAWCTASLERATLAMFLAERRRQLLRSLPTTEEHPPR